MPVAPAYRPDPRFQALGPEFADPVAPARFPETRLRFRNDRIASRVGLETLDDAEWIAAFGRFEPLPDNQPRPLAMRYHGHQFRTYNPDLGDGRGFLFAQLREADTERLLDLATKGSGKTPYSRFGDGRLTLKGGVREALATEALEAFGVPTSKTFSLIETGEDLQRPDEPSPTRSSVLTRLSWSHVRFGTFQRHAFHDRTDLITALIDHVIETYYPELIPTEGPDRVGALMAAVVERTARLAARWIMAGFVHGVLNTDNMNVTGESFDYGPYRFLPAYDPGFTAAYFDHSSLYAFGRQAESVFWNLQQLAGAMTLAVEDRQPLVEALNRFNDAYQREIRIAFVERLGVRSRNFEADGALAVAGLKLLSEGGAALRWEPLFFDWHGGAISHARAVEGPRRAVYAGEAFETFRALLDAYEPVDPGRTARACFQRSEPQELLYDEIEAIWAAIDKDDDWGPFQAKIAALGEAREAYALSAP